MASHTQIGDTHIILDGERHTLRLTLGALAAIEEQLGAGDFDTLLERLKTPSAGDLLFILHAPLLGGGASLPISALRASDINLGDASRAIAAAFATIGDGMGPSTAPRTKREAASATEASPGKPHDTSMGKPAASPGGTGTYTL
ncbi:MAG: gene transfer agent family protein [Pseudomonadota bacterium]